MSGYKQKKTKAHRHAGIKPIFTVIVFKHVFQHSSGNTLLLPGRKTAILNSVKICNLLEKL